MTANSVQNDQAFQKARDRFPHLPLPLPTQAQLIHFSNRMYADDWHVVHDLLIGNPLFGAVLLRQTNKVSTTVLHAAITAKVKGMDEIRSSVILLILEKTPSAAEIYNGFQSLPIHQICQRNVKMANALREPIIRATLEAYPDACMLPGGNFRRLPLHILFTDFYSENLCNFVLNMAPEAAKKRDKKGALPIHIACMRSSSASKAQSLVTAYPESIVELNEDGKTPLQLALGAANRAHPNRGLINALRKMEGDFLGEHLAQEAMQHELDDIEALGFSFDEDDFDEDDPDYQPVDVFAGDKRSFDESEESERPSKKPKLFDVDETFDMDTFFDEHIDLDEADNDSFNDVLNSLSDDEDHVSEIDHLLSGANKDTAEAYSSDDVEIVSV